jgi:hypothetical protein
LAAADSLAAAQAAAGKKIQTQKRVQYGLAFVFFFGKTIFVLKTDALAQTEAASFLVPVFHRDKKDIADGWIKLLNKKHAFLG